MICIYVVVNFLSQVIFVFLLFLGLIIIIIIPLFITFGDKNDGNITIEIQNTTYCICCS